MDATQEKKWFIYIGDHHEGPISISEIQEKMSQGHVTSGSFVWAEGMPDWKAMNEIDAFQSLTQSNAVQETQSAPETSAVEAHAVTEAAPLSTSEVQMADNQPVQVVGGKNMKKRLLRIILLVGTPAALAALYMTGMLNPVLDNPAVKAMTISVSEALRPQLIALSEKVPFLKGMISPIPHLEDVTPEELEELKHAAMQPEGGAPIVALAMSQGDQLMPAFYAAGNVNEGAQYFLVVTGVGDTLLNQTSFEVSRKIVFSKKMAKSEPIRSPDGKSLPRGDYFVSIQDGLPEAAPAQTAAAAAAPVAPAQNVQPGQPSQAPAAQPGQAPGQAPVQAQAAAGQPGGQPAAAAAVPAPVAKKINVLVKKQFFLGGPKDATYQQRLKEYHDRIKAKASAELNEVKQFAATLESQMMATTSAFGKLRGKSPKAVKPAQRKSWEAQKTKWQQLQKQLDQTFTAWTPEVLNRDMFYSMLYQRIQTVAGQLIRLHSIEDSYFTDTKVDAADFDHLHGPKLEELQAGLNELKAKIDQAEKLPPTPRGLPRKEGL
ncbi:MAG: DUF4339 domain-containing protein [Bdellovibrionales bacterium]|nr:DUF4339 domain-containing protein [Bdellovibrionales bacterium]